MKKAIFLTALLAVAAGVAATEPPVMGWSSWNTYRVNITDSLIMHQADEMVRLGLDSAGYRFVNIDDGFFGGRDTVTGELLFHPARFPRGLRPVTDHVHRLGLKAGIYSDAGANTCGNFWDNDTIARGVGLYRNEQRDCRLFFLDLGFDFIKVDFCGGDARQNTDSLALDPEQRYRAIREAIDSTGRHGVKLNVCRWDFPGTWAADIASSWRISHDISPSWHSVSDIIAQNLYLSAYAGNGHYNDMDMLEIGRGLSADEERTHFGLWCIMSSPLLIGCDLSALSDESLKLLKNRDLIALNQDPLGLQAYVAARADGCYVLVKDILRADSLTRAVAFYNPTDSLREVTLDFNDVDLGGTVRVKDLFDGRTWSERGGRMTVGVRPHSTEIFRLIADRRLMRRRYEAEMAYLTAYQELVNPEVAGTAWYAPDPECSGGMKVVNAGGSDRNDIQFRNVRVPAAGIYTVTLRYRSPRNCTGFISVNGHAPVRIDFPATGEFAPASVNVRLERGPNTIRLHAPASPLLEIDLLDLTLPTGFIQY